MIQGICPATQQRIDLGLGSVDASSTLRIRNYTIVCPACRGWHTSDVQTGRRPVAQLTSTGAQKNG